MPVSVFLNENNFQKTMLLSRSWQMVCRLANTLYFLKFFTSRNACVFTLTNILIQKPGSPVSIVSHYGLDDRVIGVRSQAGVKDFSSNLCVQTGSGAHPASCTVVTGGTFPGVKRGLGVTLTTHPHLVPTSRMSTSCTSSPPQAPPWRVALLNTLSPTQIKFYWST
jgi:hypothetical protein